MSIFTLSERLIQDYSKYVLIPGENRLDLTDVPDEVLNKLQAIFYTDPINAAIQAMGLE